MATFKIFFSEENIRRITLSYLPSYQEFISLLLDIYPSTLAEKQWVIKYLDSDGDKISVSSQMEWEDLISLMNGKSLMNVYIEMLGVSVERKCWEYLLRDEDVRRTIKSALEEISQLRENMEGFVEGERDEIKSSNDNQSFSKMYGWTEFYFRSKEKNFF